MDRLARVLGELGEVGVGCAHCQALPLLIFDGRPVRTAQYGSEGRCKACGFMPNTMELSELARDLAGILGPMRGPVEKSAVTVTEVERVLCEAETIATAMNGRLPHIHSHCEPQDRGS
jgi:hypothetical protein